ncbi:MAG: hypothetical protein EPN25_10035 [Nitrospirae bacterium]|nr:MAG: hypothetical protein EPN25_10035 [Nitrospirota bacterium]
MKKLIVLLIGSIMLMAGYGNAFGFGNYLSDFSIRYPAAGSISNCGLCHTNPSSPGGRNAYGTAFGNNGHNFQSIEGMDSDGDGFTNLAEITNNPPTFPGNAASKPAPVQTTCTSFTYSAFSACQSNNTQTRTVVSSLPAGCTGGSPVLTQACTFTPPVNACTSFTYSDWSACQSNNTQTRTVVGSSPAGCSGGSPALTQACSFTPPVNPPAGSTSVSVNMATGTGSATIETMTGGTNLTNVTAMTDTHGSINQHDKPHGFSFHDGLVSFKVNGVAVGGTAQVKITFPSAIPAGSKVFKVMSDGFHEYDHAAISGNTVTLTLIDGGSGDRDGVANGVIDDPVGVAAATAQDPQPAAASESGGGGCSIGPKANRATAFADSALILLPLLVITAVRTVRRRKK